MCCSVKQIAFSTQEQAQRYVQHKIVLIIKQAIVNWVQNLILSEI